MRRRWSEPRDTRAAIAAPWVAVEGFGTMNLKVTAFDAVLYEGASRGIPTTKLHSMYSRKLAAGAAVGAGHSNLYVCALPRDIDVRHIALTSATHRAHSAHVDAMRDVPQQHYFFSNTHKTKRVTIGGHEKVRPILTAPNKSLPSVLKLHQKKQWHGGTSSPG